MLDRRGMGPSGRCVCLGCGATKRHDPGIPCLDERCPRCGKAMVREGSVHHRAALGKQDKQRKSP
jgi:hypothetical protein